MYVYNNDSNFRVTGAEGRSQKCLQMAWCIYGW